MSRRQIATLAAVAIATVLAAQEEPLPYGDFETWATRDVRESSLVGGSVVELHEVGPQQTWPQNTALHSLAGSPWRTSNVYAKVSGVVKSNVSVYPAPHGSGTCAQLVTHELSCKALGIVNITVIATGSLFTGGMMEPITSSSNPMAKMDAGVPFTRRPKALKFDYKVLLSDEKRISETSFGRKKEVSGRDYCEAFILLQRRWEDDKGNIHATRIATAWQRFTTSSDWHEGATFALHYGDITATDYYRDFMELQNATSQRVYYAKNSQGKMAMIVEEAWGSGNETPTHMLIVFNSSHGKAYEGSPGNTLWVDNVALVY